MPIKKTTISVLGGGAWGTALAIQLARNGQVTYLWDIDTDNINLMIKERCNERYLPGISFPDQLHPEANLHTVLERSRDILLVPPSHAFRSLLTNIRSFLREDARIIWATKGLDPDSHQFLLDVADDILGWDIPYAILAGPNFAKEVAMGLPSATTVATGDIPFFMDIKARFSSKTFRIYHVQDQIGVQLCGAVKNVLAIATGISDGLGYGANARCALITRGLSEMTRLGLKLRAKQETFYGLAGVGDLVLTCTDNQSRNRRFGLALGAGKSLQQIEQEIGQVIEGKLNALSVHVLAQKNNISMPICEEVYRVIYENKSPKDAAEALLMRETGDE